MSIENITTAQVKALEEGTNNAVIGNSLVKRGLAVDTRDDEGFVDETGEVTKRFISVSRFQRICRFYEDAMVREDAEKERRYADAIEREENGTPTSEAWEQEQENRRLRDEQDAWIDKLREEWADATDERRLEIGTELNSLGTVMFPPGTPEYAQYCKELADALAEIVKPTVTRDPKATRYEDIARWTDERLDLTEDELMRRLRRRTLLGADRRLTESRLAKVQAEISARGL